MSNFLLDIRVYLKTKYPKYKVMNWFSRKIDYDYNTFLRKPRNFKYIKNIGYNFAFIQKIIDNGFPLFVFFQNKQYPVYVVGYVKCKLSNHKTKRFLLIQDNKINKTAFIDYDNMGMFSRIMIIKER